MICLGITLHSTLIFDTISDYFLKVLSVLTRQILKCVCVCVCVCVFTIYPEPILVLLTPSFYLYN